MATVPWMLEGGSAWTGLDENRASPHQLPEQGRPCGQARCGSGSC